MIRPGVRIDKDRSHSDPDIATRRAPGNVRDGITQTDRAGPSLAAGTSGARRRARADYGGGWSLFPLWPAGPRHVVVVAYDGVRFLDVVGPLEVFTVANEQGDSYVEQIATPGGRDVTTTTGNRLGADVALEQIGSDAIDMLIVPGNADWRPLVDPVVVAGVRRLAADARHVVSICTGTFALAAAGDGQAGRFSVRHLSRLFDEHVGMSAGQYVEHVRVEAVK